MGEDRTSSAGSKTSAHNARVKISASSKVHAKVYVFKFSRFLFRGSYFRVLVVGRENRENLDLTKISRYTAHKALILYKYHHSTKLHQKISRVCCRLYCYECAAQVIMPTATNE